MSRWQLQEAKSRLSELIQRAVTHGPQEITLRKLPKVVVLSIETYQKITQPKPSFVDFMRDSPLKGANIKLKRDTSLTRHRENL